MKKKAVVDQQKEAGNSTLYSKHTPKDLRLSAPSLCVCVKIPRAHMYTKHSNTRSETKTNMKQTSHESDEQGSRKIGYPDIQNKNAKRIERSFERVSR